MTESTDSHINKSTAQEAEVLVKVEQVSKKFCRDLKLSLWYGVQDVVSELFGLKKSQELRKNEFWAVKDVSFELKRGECLGLIGHNGAGKSTLLKVLNGLINPDKGKITMKGKVAALIELGAGFNPILTGRENVFINGAVLGFSQKEIAAKYKDIVDFAELEGFMETPVQNYSSGMKVRLGFAVAVQMEPDILIIDEVLAVGDVGFKAKSFNAIQDVMQNASVIFVTHSMPQIFRICHFAILLNKGEIELYTHSLGSAVALYLDKFQMKTQTRAMGHEEARIDKVSILDMNGQISSSFEHSHEMKMVISMWVNNKYPNFFIQIIIYNLEQRPIYEYSSNQNGRLFENCNKPIDMEVILPAISYNPGKYSVRIVAYSGMKPQKRIQQIHNVCEFVVTSNYVSWADNYHWAIWNKV